MLHLTTALILFLFPLAFSPGPGNLFFAANGARFGLRATLPAHAGYHLATWIVTAAIGLGLVATLNDAPQILMAVKYAGALYVLWIAWRILRAQTVCTTIAARPAGFSDGVILLALNPKAYVIIALMFTQFPPREELGTLTTVLLVTTVFTLNNLVSFLLWTILGDRIAAMLQSPASARTLNTLVAASLAAVSLWMALS